MTDSIFGKRLAALRAELSSRGLDAYVVPSADPHQSEYPPERWKRREAISGFTGSAGVAVIGRERAWLYVDSRYWLQAEQEADGAEWEVVRQGTTEVPDFPDWLAATVGAQGVVGIDPATISIDQERSWERALGATGARLEAVADNLVDLAWSERPELPPDPVTVLDVRFSGEAPASKLTRVREAMRAKGCRAHLVTTLDAVAWLLDLRGSDVAYNPVFVAAVVVGESDARLFVDPAKIGPAARAHLPADVEIRPYAELDRALDLLAGEGGRVWLDPATAPAAARRRLAAGRAELHQAASPITSMKARKNATELDGARAAHLRDGVALVRFLAWLEIAHAAGDVTELSAAARLEELRSRGEHFRGLSFETISAMGDHGAIVHYAPGAEGDRIVDGSSLYLLDSGAQYWDGTTDVTRTIALGTPTAEQRDAFTRVLRGHVALGRAVFPVGTSGHQLDVLARSALWEAGLDYGHGTGHGVGAYLNVHEGPHRIATSGSDVALDPGMIVSNEPGYYRAGEWGIRIESLVAVEERPELGRDGRRFRGFETLTLCPIDRGLIERDALLPAEREWIDAYHACVREALAPHLDDGERRWLERATAPL